MQSHQTQKHTVIRRDPEDTKSESVRIARLGESLYQDVERTLEVTHRGQFVVFNLANAQYVTGETRHEAMQRYRGRFGTDPGYLRKIGEHQHAGNIEF